MYHLQEGTHCATVDDFLEVALLGMLCDDSPKQNNNSVSLG